MIINGNIQNTSLKLNDNNKIFKYSEGFDYKIPSDISGCIAYYNCNTSGGLLTDNFGNYNGSFQGSVEFSDGRLSSGLGFNGSSYVNLNSNFTGSFSNGVSVSAWFKKDIILSFGETIVGGDAQDAFGFNLQFQAGSLFFRINKNLIAARNDYVDYADNKWHHVVGTYDNQTLVKLYVDNSLRATGDIGGSVIINSTDNYFIGNEPGRQYYYSGLLDEIAIYNRALNLEEINQLANFGNITKKEFKASGGKNLNTKNNFIIREV